MASQPSVNLVAPNREFINEDGLFTFNLNSTNIPAGQQILLDSASTDALNGFAVTLDPSADMQVKLAGVGDPIFGRIELAEQRRQTGQILVTVATEFMGQLPLAVGQTPKVGEFMVGGGNGTVQVYVPPASYAAANPIGLVQCIYAGNAANGYVSVLKS